MTHYGFIPEKNSKDRLVHLEREKHTYLATKKDNHSLLSSCPFSL